MKGKAWNHGYTHSLGYVYLFSIRVLVAGSRHAGRPHNYSIERLAALEARAMKRATLANILYLPIIFFGYGFLLGIAMCH